MKQKQCTKVARRRKKVGTEFAPKTTLHLQVFSTQDLLRGVRSTGNLCTVLRIMKEALIREQNFEAAAEYRDMEKEALAYRELEGRCLMNVKVEEV